MGTTYTGRRRDFMEAFGQYSPGQSIVPYVGGVIEGPQEPESDDYILQQGPDSGGTEDVSRPYTRREVEVVSSEPVPAVLTAHSGAGPLEVSALGFLHNELQLLNVVREAT